MDISSYHLDNTKYNTMRFDTMVNRINIRLEMNFITCLKEITLLLRKIFVLNLNYCRIKLLD